MHGACYALAHAPSRLACARAVGCAHLAAYLCACCPQDIFSLTQRTVKGDEEDVVLQVGHGGAEVEAGWVSSQPFSTSLAVEPAVLRAAWAGG